MSALQNDEWHIVVLHPIAESTLLNTNFAHKQDKFDKRCTPSLCDLVDYLPWEGMSRSMLALHSGGRLVKAGPQRFARWGLVHPLAAHSKSLELCQLPHQHAQVGLSAKLLFGTYADAFSLSLA